MNAEELLFDEYHHLVKVTLNKMFHNPRSLAESKGLTYDDLLQYGRLGLLDACRSWEKKQLGSFRNFAIRNIKWSIGKYIPREQLNHSYYRYYQKDDDKNKRITLLSMNHQPFGSDDETNLYDVISSDNINHFNESIESQVVSELENNELFNILKPHEKEMVQMKLKGMIEKEIATYYGVSRQCINMKFKQIQKKINKYRGVTV
jgi:RNA polymerase sigma factor (sigma-70 family)